MNDDLINIGFDSSIDNIEYNFINTNGSWQQSSKHGSLMIRPVVGASYYIGVEENSPSTGSVVFTVYPNPVRNTLHIEGDLDGSQMSIYDITGRKVLETEGQSELSVDGLCDGLYFLRVITAEGRVLNQKFIIEK